MSEENQRPPTSLRRDDRVAVDIPCHLQTEDYSFPGQVVDLSLGGAGVECNHVVLGDDIKKVNVIDIEGVGQSRVELRWRAHTRIGFAFISPNMRGTVDAYFKTVAPKPSGAYR